MKKKEIIQQQFPLQLPCYDFFQIADFTFDKNSIKEKYILRNKGIVGSITLFLFGVTPTFRK